MCGGLVSVRVCVIRGTPTDVLLKEFVSQDEREGEGGRGERKNGEY